MESRPIYLDYNATTPVDPAVIDAMMPYLREHFGNPSSTHAYGLATKRALEAARAQVARLIGAEPEEILFTSGGTEANNMVLKGVAASRGSIGRHIITTAVEHPAVLEPCEALRVEGCTITILPVDGDGRVDPADVERALSPQTILVSIMHANNEVGTVQPIAEIGKMLRERGILFHTDAAQSLGKLAVNVNDLSVDFLSIAGHKIYAPKGIGALYVRSGCELPSMIHGAGHESGRRAGTEDVFEIVGLGKACEVAGERLEATTEHCTAMRDRLWEGLSHGGNEIQRNGVITACLPNTLSISFRGVDAATLLAEVGDQVAASAGAACHAEGVDVSTVLEAMQIPLEYAMGTVRFSVGRGTTADEIDKAISIFNQAVGRLSADSPQPIASGTDDDEVRLTRYTHGMGCACKLRPQELEQVLRSLPRSTDPRVLVGNSGSDDAAVYSLRDDLAIVQSVDFFTPIADDPYTFGAISAANSLSDLYAMGAQPIFALSVVGFPSRRLPLEVLTRILLGAADTAKEAGIDIIGGHTIEDTEPKFGLCVTGTIHPDKILTNGGARPGDALVLTQPIGTGIITTATKRGMADPEVTDAALAQMRKLNRVAAESMKGFDVHACTDVTGFGLLGHLREMCAASNVDVEIESNAVPVLEGVRELAAADMIPGGTLDNFEHVSAHMDWSDKLSRTRRLILADAQTSGGLLVALPESEASKLVARLHDLGDDRAATIGRVSAIGEGRIRVA